MIWTQGEESHAISVYGTGTRITNDGSVLTSGDGSVGIYTWARNPGSDVVIVNTGVVYATGASYTNSSSFVIDAHAIQSKAPGAHIINSGIVISEQADAFALDAADQTLTMLAGSTVYGGIRFANADSGTLNLGSNLDAVLTITANVGQDLDDLTINAESGMLGVTRISATEHVVTVVSPQTVQAGTGAAANVTGSIGSMIAGHTGDRRQGLSGGSDLLGYASSPAAPAFPDFAPSDDFGIWASGYGTISAPTGDNVGATSRQGGGLVGSDIKLADDMLIGAFAGVGYGTIDGNGPNLSTTSLVGGGYASIALGTAFIDLSAAIGATINESSRRIVNNEVPAGYEMATGSYTGLFASPSIKLGFDQDLGAARLTPSIALMYTGIYHNGYTETGATTPLTMGSQFSHVVNARAELEIGSLKSDDAINGWNGSFKLGADGTVIAGGAVAADIMGTALNLAGTSAFVARGFVGANAEYKSGAYTFSASTELGYSTNGIFSASIRGGLGARF